MNGTAILSPQYLFVGLDANYAAGIETSLPEVSAYLDSGPDFWRTIKVHHPFRLPGYKGSGKRYHDKFAEIGFRGIKIKGSE